MSAIRAIAGAIGAASGYVAWERASRNAPLVGVPASGYTLVLAAFLTHRQRRYLSTNGDVTASRSRYPQPGTDHLSEPLA